MYAFIIGFNEWVLKAFIKDKEWRRTKSKDASGWELDGQIIRELKTPQAFIGMGATNCKLIVVKPEKRGGYVASPLMNQAVKEARKRGVPIEEHQVAWG